MQLLVVLRASVNNNLILVLIQNYHDLSPD